MSCQPAPTNNRMTEPTVLDFGLNYCCFEMICMNYRFAFFSFSLSFMEKKNGFFNFIWAFITFRERKRKKSPAAASVAVHIQSVLKTHTHTILFATFRNRIEYRYEWEMQSRNEKAWKYYTSIDSFVNGSFLHALCICVCESVSLYIISVNTFVVVVGDVRVCIAHRHLPNFPTFRTNLLGGCVWVCVCTL